MNDEPTRCAPPKVWPGGVRTLGPLMLIPGRSLHVDDLADAEQLHDTLGEAIEHMRAEFPDRRGRGSTGRRGTGQQLRDALAELRAKDAEVVELKAALHALRSAARTPRSDLPFAAHRSVPVPRGDRTTGHEGQLG